MYGFAVAATALALITGCSTPAPTSAAETQQSSTAETSTAPPDVASDPLAAPLPPDLELNTPIDLVDQAALPESTPTHIEIPSIGVDSELMGLGLQADGTMEVPAGGFPAGWYTGSPTPGEMGPSVIAGHVDWGGSPGVFFRLRELAAGDTVDIQRGDGSTATFTVSDIQQYPKSQFPTSSVYGDINHPGLRLITCGGAFDTGAASYDDNIVVYAKLTE